MELDIPELLKFIEKEETITLAAKEYAKENNIEYTDSFRRKCSRAFHNYSDKGVKEEIEKSTQTEEVKPKEDKVKEEISEEKVVMPSAWSTKLGRYLSIDEYCEKYNLPREEIVKYNLVAHNAGHMVFNVRFKTEEDYLQESIIDKIDSILGAASNIKHNIDFKVSDKTVDRLVYTDVHVGMDTNGTKGAPMYDGIQWNEEILMSRLEIMINHTLAHKKSSTLFIDDLGDFMDGYDGQTTRRGHELPQNMSNEKAFEVGVQFKVSLVEALLPFYEKIVCHSTVCDNHSGSYGYLVNYAAKRILEKYDNVDFVIQQRFMGHYNIENLTFILCHGKDTGEMKFGFKPFISQDNIAKIDAYCKENKLYNGNIIEFSKGDSHQGVFDDTSSNDFFYYNYPAFSPPSNWVQTNFKNTKSGFIFFNLNLDTNTKIIAPYYFS